MTKVMTRQQKKSENNRLERGMNAEFRAVEGSERTFELSFSSEEPYDRWFGPEILSHREGCVNLERLNSIGVVLFNHRTDYVVGKVLEAWVDDNRGKAKIEFDSDAEAEKIFQKVKSGTLRGVSVGYDVNSWEVVSENAESKYGFKGPCRVATEWTPLEISIVSVPADSSVGVGRSMEETEEMPDIWQWQVKINANRNEEE